MAVVAEAREDAALLGLLLGLVVQTHFFKAFFGQLVMALAVAGLLHRRARCGARAAHIKRSPGIYGPARVERLAGIRLVDIVDNGRTCRDVLCHVSSCLAVEAGKLTNDRLYESKLSREMLNGSFSARRLRWFEDVVETLDFVCQNVGFSCCGDGYCRNVNQCLAR